MKKSLAVATSLIATAVAASPAAAAPVASVTPTDRPVLSGGSYDTAGNLKVYGGQTAANWATGSATYQSTRTQATVVGTNTTWRSQGWQWFRSKDGTTDLESINAAAAPGVQGKGAAYRPTRDDVGFHLVLRNRLCYDWGFNVPSDFVCSSSGSTYAGDYSLPTDLVTHFASSNPVAAFKPSNPNRLATTRGVWQGVPTGSTVAFQWQKCTGDGTGCTDIAGKTASAITLNPTTNANAFYRAKVTITTPTEGGTRNEMVVTATSNSVGYKLPG